MTPLQIKMLLHYHAIAEPYAMRELEHANSPAVTSQRSELCQLGLIEVIYNDIGYRTTEKGEVYVEAICNLPLPVQKWILP